MYHPNNNKHSLIIGIAIAVVSAILINGFSAISDGVKEIHNDTRSLKLTAIYDSIGINSALYDIRELKNVNVDTRRSLDILSMRIDELKSQGVATNATIKANRSEMMATQREVRSYEKKQSKKQ